MSDSRFARVTRAFTATGTYVEVVGELDMDSAPELRRVLTAAIVTGGIVELDLSGVSFIDSCGLGAVLEAKDVAEQYKVDMHVVETTAHVQRLLRLTRQPDLWGPAISHTA